MKTNCYLSIETRGLVSQELHKNQLYILIIHVKILKDHFNLQKARTMNSKNGPVDLSNQSAVSTAKRLASLFRYFIASSIDTLHNTINGYGFNLKLHAYGSRSSKSLTQLDASSKHYLWAQNIVLDKSYTKQLGQISILER